MLDQNEILSTIKAIVTNEMPDAKVYLFGSRVTGIIHEESDWDILILTQKKYPKSYKWVVQEKLFPLSLSIGSVFSYILATNDEWGKSPFLLLFTKRNRKPICSPMSRKKDAIELKLKKAKALMDEIDFQLKNKFYNTAINRLYYSCFHATKALLLTKDLVPKTHSGVSTLLHQKFVLTGLFDPAHAAFFNKLMNERMDDDYSDFMISDMEEIDEFVKPAKEYLIYTTSTVTHILNSD